jgi:hypothetical protein
MPIVSPLLHEVSLRERATGAGLEVAFEGDGARLAGEFESHDKTPRSILGGVLRATGVVNVETSRDVRGEPDVVAVWIDGAHENVYEA